MRRSTLLRPTRRNDMAKHCVTHLCGHDVQYTLGRLNDMGHFRQNEKEAEKYSLLSADDVWRLTNIGCWACVGVTAAEKRRQADRQQQATEEMRRAGLPDLEGPERLIGWANINRESQYRYFSRKETGQWATIGKKWFDEHCCARWWLNFNRNDKEWCSSNSCSAYIALSKLS